MANAWKKVCKTLKSVQNDNELKLAKKYDKVRKKMMNYGTISTGYETIDSIMKQIEKCKQRIFKSWL